MARDVSVGYDRRIVVRGFSASLSTGETLRLAGPNGSGKSTLVRALAGVDAKQGGIVMIDGADLDTDPTEARRRLGFSAGNCPFPYLTGREHLGLSRRIYRGSKTQWDITVSRFAHWAAVVRLDDQVRTYSHGMHQQLAFLIAIIHDPAVLFLDEALDGLDTDTLADAATFLRERAASGGALVHVGHRDDGFAAFPRGHTIQLSRTA